MVTRRAREGLHELLATNVRIMRASRRWSQEELAAEAGLHRTQVGAIERAEKDIRLSTLERLVAAFRATPADLLS